MDTATSPAQLPLDQVQEPPRGKHKLGQALARDLTEMRAKISSDLYRVRDKMLARLEYMLDNNPDDITFANLSIGYGILTDKQLLLEQGPVSTTNNTIVINGLSRAQALGFLRDGGDSNGFFTTQAPREPVISAYVDMTLPVQNTPGLVDNAQPVQR